MLDYAAGVGMIKGVYRAAYDEAKAELADILREFEHLRLRKEQLEKIVEALKPIAETIETDQKGKSDSTWNPPWSGR
jgi:hypothetical protein